jgi:CRISP-associated protein Cas1
MRTRLSELTRGTVQEILTLRDHGMPLRKIASSVGISHGSVIRLIKRETNGSDLTRPPPRIPARPRNGAGALPDFARVDQAISKGATIKQAWQSYARSAAKPYSYEYFSTLYGVWLAEQRTRAVSGDAAAEPITAVPDYTAEEDNTAEAYWKNKLDPRSTVHVLSGYRCSLAMKNGELVTYDGAEECRFAKVTHGLTAIIFLDFSGVITIPAVHWCHAQGVSIFTLGWHGELVSVLNAALLPHNKIGDSSALALRRAQFRANPLGVAKAILAQKTESQFRHGKVSAATLGQVAKQIKVARSVTELLTIEAQTALEYWDRQRFTLRHKKRNWPDAWTTFAYRASPISGGPRYAMHPVNAILNYAYSIVAAQLTRSLAAHGFDPACGFLHADAPGRYSLAYDVMELLRADIDAKLLAWVGSHAWKRPDFPVTPEGVVRLQPTLAADDELREYVWATGNRLWISYSGRNALLTELRKSEAELHKDAGARVSHLFRLGYYDTAVREACVQLEDEIKKYLNVNLYGNKLTEKLITHLLHEKKILESHVRTFRQELRTVFKFIRNDFMHNLREADEAAAYAMLFRITRARSMLDVARR